MERRTKVILGIAAALFLIGILFILFRSSSSGPTGAPSPESVTPSKTGGGLSRSGTLTPSSSGGGVVNAPAVPPAPEVAVRQLAITFAERYGSFSSEGNYVNITDLFPLMTERYQRALETFVRQQRAAPSTGFQSTTSTILTTSVRLPATDANAATQATAMVTAQRTTVTGSGPSTVTAQDLELTLLKTSDGWRVDGATWKASGGAATP